MKRAALLFALSIAAMPLFAATGGTASGSLVVNDAARPLTHAWVIEKNALLRVILASAELDDAALFDRNALQEAVSGSAISALVIQLDEDRNADTTYFFDPRLPAGLEIRQIGTFTHTKSDKRTLAGHVVLDDDGYSFSYDATFDAPIRIQQQVIEPLGGAATATEHALWRLRQMDLPFDEMNFRNAVIEGNADTVELFLKAGMPVTAAGALGEAVGRGKTEVVKVLLGYGADANEKDQFGQSHVMNAVSTHHAGVLELLIAAGADVSKPNQYRVTPLAVAAEQGHLDLVQMLIAAGVKVNARDTAGGTALSVAILRGYKEIVASLLAAGADVQRDKDDLLMLAAEKPEILEMLEHAIAAKTKR